MKIQDQNAFPAAGRFYKGNLHTHTTRSDGKASPEERIAEYRAAGYDFLALTDHNVYGDGAMPYADFLLLPGVELDCPPNGDESLGYHTVGIGLPGENTLSSGRVEAGHTAAEQIAFLNAHGNFAVIAHPYWLQTDMEAFLAEQGAVGFEVYNALCQTEFGTGFSEAYWDHAVRHGRFPLAFAADDTHAAATDGAIDRPHGYIKVKASALTQKDIIEAVLAGHFFASCGGPDILDFAVRDGKAIVETSPCRQICLRSPRTFGSAVNAFDDTLTRAEFSLSGEERVIRAVATDREGRCSWTQLLPIKPV